MVSVRQVLQQRLWKRIVTPPTHMYVHGDGQVPGVLPLTFAWHTVMSVHPYP